MSGPPALIRWFPSGLIRLDCPAGSGSSFFLECDSAPSRIFELIPLFARTGLSPCRMSNFMGVILFPLTVDSNKLKPISTLGASVSVLIAAISSTNLPVGKCFQTVSLSPRLGSGRFIVWCECQDPILHKPCSWVSDSPTSFKYCSSWKNEVAVRRQFWPGPSTAWMTISFAFNQRPKRSPPVSMLGYRKVHLLIRFASLSYIWTVYGLDSILADEKDLNTVFDVYIYYAAISKKTGNSFAFIFEMGL